MPTLSTSVVPIENSAVAAAFDAWPEDDREALLRLRDIIFETAAQTEGAGPLEETLKWGQPSYLTSESGSGSTVRLGSVKGMERTVAMYFHCQTDLVATFRRLYPETFTYEGNRAIHLKIGHQIPRSELSHCVALALTYHARKKGR